MWVGWRDDEWIRAAGEETRDAGRHLASPSGRVWEGGTPSQEVFNCEHALKQAQSHFVAAAGAFLGMGV